MKSIKQKIVCIILALVMSVTVFIAAACTPQKTDTASDEDALKAADPMTEEEMENDDTGGCIEDAEDLLN